MTAGHLVTRLKTSLHRKINLNHLKRSGRQLVALGELAMLFLIGKIELMTLLIERFFKRLQLSGGRLVGKTNVKPVMLVDFCQVVGCKRRSFGKLFRPTVGWLTNEELFDSLEHIGLNNAKLIVEVFSETTKLIINNLLGALVALNALAGKDLNINDGSAHARGHAQRRVFHVRGLLAENGTKQFFFRRKLGFAFWRDLTYQNVTGLNFGADVDHA